MSIFNYIRGKYDLVRSHSEGVNAGKVLEADASGVVLQDARRLWFHVPAEESQSWYEGVANTGLGPRSKVSAVVPLKVIVEDYSMTVCSVMAEESIRNFDAHATS